MRPETQLAIVAAFIGFLLKTSLGFCICWAIGKTLVSPGRKFLIWFGFLAGAGCYWLWLGVGFVPDGAVLAPLQIPVSLALTAPVGIWQIRPSWQLPLAIALPGLGVLYLLFLGHSLFARIRKQMHLRLILRFAYGAPEVIEKLFKPVAESLNVSNAQLLVLSGIHSPATFGWKRPIVLLPSFCLEQDSSELGDIFRHELQHIRRRDFVFNTVASVCRALLFFHPAAWYAMRRLELESELACDLAVVSDSPERRATYAECLVRFARLNVAEGPKPWNLDFAGSSSVQLKVRIRSMLAETRKIPGWLLGLRATFGLLLFAAFLGIVPSLFIVLSYEQHRVVQPVKPTLLATRTHVRLQKRRAFRIRLQREAADATRTFASPPPTVPTVVPVEASLEPAPIVPRVSNPKLSNEPLSSEPRPTLKRRSDVSAVAAPKSAPATTIPIATQPSSQTIITKRRAVASILTTAAGVAVRIAAHGQDGGDH